jgi:anti-sigma regulatory factor (Ser/Thr protein kinase)
MHTPAPRALAPRTTSVTYPGTTEQIRAVRADLRGLLGDCPMADDVILCASELAANAAIHSRSRMRGGTFTVRTTISPGNYAWVEVEDSGGPWTSAISDPTRRHGSTSSVPSPATGASTGTTPSASSGQDSTGPAMRDSAPVSPVLPLCGEDFLYDHQGRARSAPDPVVSAR